MSILPSSYSKKIVYPSDAYPEYISWIIKSGVRPDQIPILYEEAKEQVLNMTLPQHRFDDKDRMSIDIMSQFFTNCFHFINQQTTPSFIPKTKKSIQKEKEEEEIKPKKTKSSSSSKKKRGIRPSSNNKTGGNIETEEIDLSQQSIPEEEEEEDSFLENKYKEREEQEKKSSKGPSILRSRSSTTSSSSNSSLTNKDLMHKRTTTNKKDLERIMNLAQTKYKMTPENCGNSTMYQKWNPSTK